LATAVDTRTYKVDFQRGLHIGLFWYWHPDITKIRGKKGKLEVRLDPENPYVVYALIDNNWVTCSNPQINLFSIKGHDAQFVEGLIQLESSEARNAEKQAADEMLVKIIREMDGVSDGKPSVPVISLDKTDGDKTLTIKKSVVQKVDIKFWEKK